MRLSRKVILRHWSLGAKRMESSYFLNVAYLTSIDI